MKRVCLILFAVGISFSVLAQKDWQKQGVKIPPPICYASDHSHKHHTPPPSEFLNRLKSTNDKQAVFVVDYVGFPDSAKTAFQHAVDIWESLIYSPVSIHMLARWTSLDDGVLGSCGPYAYFQNFDAAHYKDRYYPVALVEKMEGEEVTGSEIPDMIAQFNSDFDNWYFGTDGDTPEGKYDFVSIVLHEIAHGLGFTGFFYEGGGLGHYGGELDIPGIFDEFVLDSFNKQLVDTSEYDNHSEELLDALDGPVLYMGSLTAKAAQGNNLFPRLYAPNPFNDGSSVYHLNEFSYGASDPNALMTPFAETGNAIHDPGPFTMGIFADMGWQFISIKHDEISDTEDANSDIAISAEVFSDEELDSSSVQLVYTLTGFEEADSIQMVYNETTQHFELEFPISGAGERKYYISASDIDGVTYRLPGIAPERVFDFFVGPDTIKPEITHRPIRSILESELTADIFVEINENIGIEEAVVEYFINDQDVQNLDLVVDSATTYKSTFQFQNLVDGDSIRYRIKVTDSSSNSNTAFFPEEEYFTIFIDGTFDPVSEYFTDFDESNNRDFISNDFVVSVENGFDNGALHSPHPYPSPDQDDTTFEFTAMLKYPITIKNGGIVRFNEVVLVEPGNPNTVFGDDEFWDYVIVEGSLNGEDNWKSLVDGYDSGQNTSWLNLYNGSISGNNSTAVGNKNLYVQRSFRLDENDFFGVGESIFIRFRIFSDPYANGWGWAIDDLSIQDKATASDELKYSPGEVQVFPNPVESELNITANFQNAADYVKVNILSSSGTIIYEEGIAINGQSFNETINVRSFVSGIYLVILSFDNGEVLTRKIVK